MWSQYSLSSKEFNDLRLRGSIYCVNKSHIGKGMGSWSPYMDLDKLTFGVELGRRSILYNIEFHFSSGIRLKTFRHQMVQPSNDMS